MANASKELSDNPRLVAFQVLSAVGDGRAPEDVFEEMGPLLGPKDQNLATAMVYEALRHQSYLDAVLKSRLATGTASRGLSIILRLGLAQLLFFDRLGEHAVVMESVNLAKALTPGRQGVVNAILRGLIRSREAGEPWPPRLAPSGRTDEDLAALYSHPLWLVRQWLKLFGEERTRDLLEADNRPTPPTLRVNPLKTERGALAELLPFETSQTELSPWGLSAEKFSGRPETWPGYNEGFFSVQDEASQLLGLFIPDRRGLKILDGCAGLGGKALHLASLQPDAQVTALDKDGAKLAALKKEARRLGLTNIETRAGDLLELGARARFDLILVDAPCSGLGVIRRRPDLKWRKTAQDPARLAPIQLRLLSAAAEALAPGGRLIYSVCTLSAEETFGVARKFLNSHPEFAPIKAENRPAQLSDRFTDDFLMLLPPSTDGFFIAAFERV